ncbi:uncharacterized protein NECHADRAFT_99741 [Fusarium vanettenii 77-13-4]|uniref:Uncharacterized protein n=1 Tax=Fusarium vanettenii (strain ATCC MYA-4622 / CBS 123669 / FGSC 9596 / NRRL 45880 / 77-13-4) TaxID=660122 RepID=C7YN30_FUSV7|nr:uncharacterized protein NECHADRAFT_99741 [Fusarium vanettenii 77-13-4]EEU47053.1 predicted protein [Fusarium vanettenii 77-13-4]
MCSPRQQSSNVNVPSQTQVFLARGKHNRPITAPPLPILSSIGFIAELPFTDDVPRPWNLGTLSNGWRIPGTPDLNAEEVRIRYLLIDRNNLHHRQFIHHITEPHLLTPGSPPHDGALTAALQPVRAPTRIRGPLLRPPRSLASVPPRWPHSLCISDDASGHTTDEPNDAPTEDNSYRGLPHYYRIFGGLTRQATPFSFGRSPRVPRSGSETPTGISLDAVAHCNG